jgi:hypothetical protein
MKLQNNTDKIEGKDSSVCRYFYVAHTHWEITTWHEKMTVQVCLNQTKKVKYESSGDLEHDVFQISERKEMYMHFIGMYAYPQIIYRLSVSSCHWIRHCRVSFLFCAYRFIFVSSLGIYIICALGPWWWKLGLRSWFKLIKEMASNATKAQIFGTITVSFFG